MTGVDSGTVMFVEGRKTASLILVLVVGLDLFCTELQGQQRTGASPKNTLEQLSSSLQDVVARVSGMSPGRIPFLIKDPRGFKEFYDALAKHDPQGSAHTQRGFQGGRPPLYEFEADIKRGVRIYEAVGCPDCNDGYKGRLGIYQVMQLTEEIQKIILQGGNTLQIAEAAKKAGVNDLRASALLKVKKGMTSLAEIDCVTKD